MQRWGPGSTQSRSHTLTHTSGLTGIHSHAHLDLHTHTRPFTHKFTRILTAAHIDSRTLHSHTPHTYIYTHTTVPGDSETPCRCPHKRPTNIAALAQTSAHRHCPLPNSTPQSLLAPENTTLFCPTQSCHSHSDPAQPAQPFCRPDSSSAS